MRKTKILFCGDESGCCLLFQHPRVIAQTRSPVAAVMRKLMKE